MRKRNQMLSRQQGGEKCLQSGHMKTVVCVKVCVCDAMVWFHEGVYVSVCKNVCGSEWLSVTRCEVGMSHPCHTHAH